MNIWVARHGAREDKEANRLYRGGVDPAITREGIDQAKRTGKALCSQRIDYIYASPFRRTVMTAVEIARAVGVKVQVHNALCEVLLPSMYQAQPRLDTTYKLDTRQRHYLNPAKLGDFPIYPETEESARARCEAALNRIIVTHKGETIGGRPVGVLLVTHGFLVVSCYEALVGETWPARLEPMPACCSLTHFAQGDGRKWKLAGSAGCTAHLARPLLDFTPKTDKHGRRQQQPPPGARPTSAMTLAERIAVVESERRRLKHELEIVDDLHSRLLKAQAAQQVAAGAAAAAAGVGDAASAAANGSQQQQHLTALSSMTTLAWDQQSQQSFQLPTESLSLAQSSMCKSIVSTSSAAIPACSKKLLFSSEQDEESFLTRDTLLQTPGLERIDKISLPSDKSSMHFTALRGMPGGGSLSNLHFSGPNAGTTNPTHTHHHTTLGIDHTSFMTYNNSRLPPNTSGIGGDGRGTAARGSGQHFQNSGIAALQLSQATVSSDVGMGEGIKLAFDQSTQSCQEGLMVDGEEAEEVVAAPPTTSAAAAAVGASVDVGRDANANNGGSQAAGSGPRGRCDVDLNDTFAAERAILKRRSRLYSGGDSSAHTPALPHPAGNAGAACTSTDAEADDAEDIAAAFRDPLFGDADDDDDNDDAHAGVGEPHHHHHHVDGVMHGKHAHAHTTSHDEDGLDVDDDYSSGYDRMHSCGAPLIRATSTATCIQQPLSASATPRGQAPRLGNAGYSSERERPSPDADARGHAHVQNAGHPHARVHDDVEQELELDSLDHRAFDLSAIGSGSGSGSADRGGASTPDARQPPGALGGRIAGGARDAAAPGGRGRYHDPACPTRPPHPAGRRGGSAERGLTRRASRSASKSAAVAEAGFPTSPEAAAVATGGTTTGDRACTSPWAHLPHGLGPRSRTAVLLSGAPMSPPFAMDADEAATAAESPSPSPSPLVQNAGGCLGGGVTSGVAVPLYRTSSNGTATSTTTGAGGVSPSTGYSPAACGGPLGGTVRRMALVHDSAHGESPNAFSLRPGGQGQAPPLQAREGSTSASNCSTSATAERSPGPFELMPATRRCFASSGGGCSDDVAAGRRHTALWHGVPHDASGSGCGVDATRPSSSMSTTSPSPTRTPGTVDSRQPRTRTRLASSSPVPLDDPVRAPSMGATGITSPHGHAARHPQPAPRAPRVASSTTSSPVPTPSGANTRCGFEEDFLSPGAASACGSVASMATAVAVGQQQQQQQQSSSARNSLSRGNGLQLHMAQRVKPPPALTLRNGSFDSASAALATPSFCMSPDRVTPRTATRAFARQHSAARSVSPPSPSPRVAASTPNHAQAAAAAVPPAVRHKSSSSRSGIASASRSPRAGSALNAGGGSRAHMIQAIVSRDNNASGGAPGARVVAP